MASIDERRALIAFQDHLEIIFDQREKQGELGMPNFLAALELLPEAQRQYVGTGMCRTFINLLLHQNIKDRLHRELNRRPIESSAQKIWARICELLSIPHEKSTVVFPTILPDSMLPSFIDEVEWLRNNADLASPTECMMMSELHGFAAKGEVTPEMQKWYERGLRAAKKLAEKNPDMTVKICQ